MNFVYVDGHRGGLLLGQVGAEGSRKHGARCRCGSRQDIASSVRRVLDGRTRTRRPEQGGAALCSPPAALPSILKRLT